MSLPRLIIGLAGLLALGFYGFQNPPVPKLSQILQSAENYVGEEISLFVETTVDSINSNGFRVRQLDATIWVRGDVPDLEMNEFVSLVGVLQGDETLKLKEIYVAKNRRLKMAISVVALIIVALPFGYFVQWRGSGLEVRERA